MTITLTVEEIKKFEDALFSWHAKRFSYAVDLTVDVRQTFGGMKLGPQDQGKVSEQLAIWEKNCPRPRLLPEI